MGEWGEFTLVVVAVGLAAYVLVVLATGRKSVPDPLGPDPALADADTDAFAGGLAEAFSRNMPSLDRDMAEIQPQLLRAGFYSPTSLIKYRAIRALLIILPLIVGGLVCLLVPHERIPNVAIGSLAFAALGYSLPRVYVASKARARARQTEQGLPVFADMLTLALLAGQNILNGLRRVAVEIRQAYPVIADELELVVRQAELNTLPHAFEQWAARSQVAEVSNLVQVLTQAQRMGTDITAALMEFANNTRTQMQQNADAQAQRAGLWMMFPNILCLWIPAAVILVAPLAFEFKERRAKARESIQKQIGSDSLEDAVRKNSPQPKEK